MRPLVSIAKTLLVPLIVIGVIAAGIAAYVWWLRPTTNPQEQGAWTCSMHPQIRRDGPGQCPICGMNLIPVSQLSKEQDRQAAMGVETELVAFRALVKELRTVGKFDYSENKIA
jgi:membrane fusion protein, copper/silver efflux system